MRIVADLDKITANARATVELCGRHGIEVTAVPSASAANRRSPGRSWPAAWTIAESRIDNVRRLRDAGVDCDILMLRLPALSQVDDVVALTTGSLNSEARVLHALSEAAARQGKTHEVIVIVEWGDRREGVMPEEAAALCRLAWSSPASSWWAWPAASTACAGCFPRREHARLRLVRRSWSRTWACASGSSAAATRTTCASSRAAACRVASTTCAWARASCSERTASATSRCREACRHVQGLRRGHRAQGEAVRARWRGRAGRVHAHARVAGPGRPPARRPGDGRDRPRREWLTPTRPGVSSSPPAPTTRWSTSPRPTLRSDRRGDRVRRRVRRRGPRLVEQVAPSICGGVGDGRRRGRRIGGILPRRAA